MLMSNENLEKSVLSYPTGSLSVILFHVETMDGLPLGDVPFGDLEHFLNCVLMCHDCVVVHTKPCEP